jgi:EmrB/QacA subfamily drug resistance transporter
MTVISETPRLRDRSQADPETTTRLGSPGRVFGVVALAVFLATLDMFIVNIAFPAIRTSFAGASVSSVSWVLNVYAIVFAALLVPAGKLGDILGRRRVFVAGLVAFAAGSALCAAAPSLAFLIAARVLQGVGAAAVTPTSLGLLLPAFPVERRATAIGGWAAIGAVGAASGPPLGGLLTQISWHWIFIINVPLALLAAAAAVRLVAEVRDPAKPPLPDALGTVLLIVAIGALTLGLVKSSDWSWDVRVIGAAAAAVFCGAGFVMRSRRHPAPVLEMSIVRQRAFALASASAALFFAAFAAMLLSNVIFLTDVWHYSALKAGLALTPGPLAAATFAPVSGRLTARLGPGTVGALGALAFALGSLWWISKIGLRPQYAADFLPGMIVGGIGVGLVLPAFSVAATATLASERLATGIGAQTMFRQLGSTLGVAAFVAILGTPAQGEVLDAFSHTRVFMVVTAGVAALALTLIRRRPAPAAEPANSHRSPLRRGPSNPTHRSER